MIDETPNMHTVHVAEEHKLQEAALNAIPYLQAVIQEYVSMLNQNTPALAVATAETCNLRIESLILYINRGDKA